MHAARLPAFLFLSVLAVMAWSWVNPHDRFTWWLESIPVIVALPLLAATYKKCRFTDLLYVLVAAHCVVLLVGGHYTYARVPLFDDLKPIFGFERNHYDRVGHFMQGFVPVMVGRELILRTTPIKPGKWLFALLVLSGFGISAIYEIIEWMAAVWTGDAATDFLGTQGDVWDTQKDMALAGLGALAALLLLGRVHDRALHKFIKRAG